VLPETEGALVVELTMATGKGVDGGVMAHGQRQVVIVSNRETLALFPLSAFVFFFSLFFSFLAQCYSFLSLCLCLSPSFFALPFLPLFSRISLCFSMFLFLFFFFCFSPFYCLFFSIFLFAFLHSFFFFLLSFLVVL